MTSSHKGPVTVKTELQLPHNIDVEHQVIGLTVAAEMSNRSGVWKEFCTLKPEDFFEPLHQAVWSAIHRLHEQGKPVDIATVLGETSAEYGGVDSRGAYEIKRLLCECAGGIVTWVNSAHYASLMRDMADKRLMIYGCLEHARKASTLGYTSPASDLAGTAINDLQARIGGKRDLIGATSLLDQIEKDLDAPVHATPTGLERLDSILLGGFHRGRFYGLSASQKAGKTAMMGPTISYNMAKAKRPHVYIGLEMQAQEIFMRYLARWMAEETGSEINSNIFYDRSQTGQKWFRELLRDARQFFDEKNCGLWFLQRPRMHIDELKSTLARIGLSGQYEGVFIDYMQLIGGCQGENMTAHLDNVNQTIAECVSTYPMWVCAAAQENNEGTVRYGSGMRAAVDMLLSLQKFEYTHRNEHGDEVPYYKSCIEMQASRYTQMMHVGSEDEPAYDFDVTSGPCYRELPRPNVKKFMQGLQNK